DVWSAWVAEVKVDTQTGAIGITRLTVGHDAQSMQVAPSANRIEDQVRQAASRWLPSGSNPPPSSRTDAPTRSDAGQRSLLEPSVQIVPSGLEVNAPIAWSAQAELPAAAAISN